LARLISKEKTNFILKEFFQDLSSLGSIFNQVFLIVFFLILEKTNLGITLFINIIISTLLCYVIRFFYFKERPHKRSYKTLLEKLDASSFPSTHTARSFGAALILSYYFPELLILILLLAIGIAISRIYLKHHYKIDVIFGILIGILSGFVSINF
jgi:undecaprenyl-diphosphatase